MKNKIFLVEDHEVVRVGIRRIFSGSEFEIVGTACSLGVLADQVRQSGADILLRDVMLGGANALDQLAKMRQVLPDFPVLIYSAFDNPTFIRRAIDLKVLGYVLKTNESGELLNSLRLAAQNKSALTSEEIRRVTGAMATTRLNFNGEVPLTHRESEVLIQVVQGLTNKEIAQELHISYETVKEHVQHILRKIGVSDRTQAAVWAVRQGIA